MKDEYRHVPVLLEESIEGLKLRDGSIALDCTLGGAGHSAKIASCIAPNGILIGLDQDDASLAKANLTLQNTHTLASPVLIKGNFGDLDHHLLRAQIPYVDAVLFDLGVSSPQFDFPNRGFTYRQNAPLDMRMDQHSTGKTAAEILNTYSQLDLYEVLKAGGEEKWALRIASFICKARQTNKFKTTDQLVDVVKNAIPAKMRRIGGHPAKRTFQALRIEVNDELAVLKRGLQSAIRWLSPGGRIVVISYHSIEDSIVKHTFLKFANRCICPADLPVCACGRKPIVKIVTKRAICPSSEEIENNPRARSARLRIAQKCSI